MIYIILGILLLVSPSIAIASGHCEAHAEAFLGVLEFDITGCKIEGDMNYKDGELSGDFFVVLDNLDTGLELRNEHMREKYLETKKYDKARFVLSPLKLGEKNFSGKLTLHGVSKQISGKVISSNEKSLKVSFQVDLSDFKIATPEYKGISIAKNINFSATVVR